MTTKPKPWTCPECGGAWIRNYVFRHKANACTIGEREDNTQASDFFRTGDTAVYVRSHTTAERELYNAISTEPLPADSDGPYLTKVTGHTIRERTVHGLNPDNITE